VFNPEIRNRIRIAVAAYAYEFESHPIMSDAAFDHLARTIRPMVLTGHMVLDRFFMTTFDPSTGAWIHRHPELSKVRSAYEKWYR
jgi:hypothetical protein